jgi:K+-transporting ATPase ATPase C chain
MRLPVWLGQYVAALRALVVFTLLLGVAYPLLLVTAAKLPGLSLRAHGTLVTAEERVVGSRLIGQAFTDADGEPLEQYFQPRPSAAADGYDPTSTSASNLGPEDVVDTPGRPSLLTQVCARSLAVAELEGVDGSRPFCTYRGVGAVLGVFYRDGLSGPVTRVVSPNETEGPPFLASYEGVPVEAAERTEDYSGAVVTPIRGDAPATPEVPADAVTASASGLDPHSSPDYARLQATRVARVRGIAVSVVDKLIVRHTAGRALGFMGEPTVNVLELNLELDRRFPV